MELNPFYLVPVSYDYRVEALINVNQASLTLLFEATDEQACAFLLQFIVMQQITTPFSLLVTQAASSSDQGCGSLLTLPD